MQKEVADQAKCNKRTELLSNGSKWCVLPFIEVFIPLNGMTHLNEPRRKNTAIIPAFQVIDSEQKVDNKGDDSI